MSTRYFGDTPLEMTATARVWDVVVITAPGRPGPEDELSVGVVTHVTDDGVALRASRPGMPDWTREGRPNSEVLVARGVDSRAVVGGLRLRGSATFTHKREAALFLQPYRGDMAAPQRQTAKRPPLPEV